MDLSKIISISGMSGLFKVIAQSKSGLIVESLADKKRMPAHASSKVNILDNISVYLSSGETTPVQEVLKKIYEKQGGKEGPDSKSSDDELIKYFGQILPDYDKEKVHTSDIRKIILWYSLLQKTDIFTQKDEPKKDDAPLILEGDQKKPDTLKPREIPNKHINAGGQNAPKKTIGVRKTGVA